MSRHSLSDRAKADLNGIWCFPPRQAPLSFLQTVYLEPLPAVVDALRSQSSVDAILEETPVRVLPLFDRS